MYITVQVIRKTQLLQKPNPYVSSVKSFGRTWKSSNTEKARNKY